MEQNTVQLFKNQEFGNIRIIEVDGKPYFVAIDVAKILEYKRPADAITAHCKGSVKYRVLTRGGNQNLKVIPEGDVYRLIVKASTQSQNKDIQEKAEKFESWIFDEVLPTIRKTGGYVNNGDLFVNTYFSSLPQTEKQLVRGLVSNIEAQQKTITEQQTLISTQENKLTELKPKEEFYDTVAAAEDSITINRMAGILFDKEKIHISQKKLFDFLEKQHYLCTDKNVYHKPTQTMLNRGYMTYREHSRRTYDHRNQYYRIEISFTPLITGKGQIFITNRIKELYTS